MVDKAITLDSATGHLAADAEARIIDLVGAEISAAGLQAQDDDLDAIAALNPSGSGMIASDGAGWIRKSYAQVKTALALSAADVGLGNVTNVAQAAAARLISAGYGLTGGGSLAADRTLAVQLTKADATLAVDVTGITALTTVLSLAIPSTGTWLISAGLTAQAGATAASVDGKLSLGTATGTLTGVLSGTGRCAANVYASVICTALLECTGAGTVVLGLFGSNAVTCKAASSNGYAGATAITAVRIA